MLHDLMLSKSGMMPLHRPGGPVWCTMDVNVYCTVLRVYE